MAFDSAEQSPDVWSLTDVVVAVPAPGDLNTMLITDAAGLPPGYAGDAWREVIARTTLRDAVDRAELAHRSQNPNLTFADRYAAGALLGLLGDPRIDPYAPRMVEVPAGRYRVGLERDRVGAVARRYAELGVKQSWIAKEAPRHLVELAKFRIAAYPVTNAEYAEFLADHPSEAPPSSWRFGTIAPGQANHPVFTVTPDAAERYAQWLSQRTGRAYRLPTEAEWEVAAGGGEREFPWGDEYSADRANTLESGLLWTSPVGIFPSGRSHFGCFDMAGNVEEFVSNGYAPYPGADVEEDDLALIDPDYRIARGGSFSRYRDLARCARRHGNITGPLYAIGFRLAAGPVETAGTDTGGRVPA